MNEIRVQVKVPTRMMVGDQAAIKLIWKEVTSRTAKHVDVKLKFIRDASDR